MGNKAFFIIITGKQTMGLLAGVCFCLGLTIAMLPLYVSVEAPNYDLGRYTIVIDPGHGGRDPGAVGSRGLLEKEMVLDIGLRLRDRFTAARAHVIMTRTSDGDLAPPDAPFRQRADLLHRAALANDSEAHIYLSIHGNSAPDPQWSGAQTFYYSEGDRSLATMIQRELVRQLGPNHRQARWAPFRVLRDTQMPAALVEVGFLSNPKEEGMLADALYRERIAAAIFDGTVLFLINYFPREEGDRPVEGGSFPGDPNLY
ncbi:MAG: N-acetylmuramoyl-L-alanine amidase family protein [Limnochordia bacterium]|jgi:N-acetylmuramoyl-L-alanine amidase